MKKINYILGWFLVIALDAVLVYVWFRYAAHSLWMQGSSFGLQLAFSVSFTLTILNFFLFSHLYGILKDWWRS